MRDDEKLYVAFECHEAKTGNGSPTDGSFLTDNCVAVELKPDPRQKWFYRAAVDALGRTESVCAVDKPFSILTLALQKPKTRKWEWPRTWESAVRREKALRITELAVPFAALRRTADRETWALNLYCVRDGEETSWSPTYRGSWQSGHWASTFRSAAERFRFGTLANMSGTPALRPCEGLYHVSDLALQYQPDGTLALMAQIESAIRTTWKELTGALEVEVTGPEQETVKRTAMVPLRSGRQQIKIASLGLKPIRGSYAVGAKLVGRKDGFVFDAIDSWQAIAYGHTFDAGLRPPSILFDHTYFPPMYELRAQTEFSYYADESQARLLVESSLGDDLVVTVRPPGHGRKLGQRRLPAKGRVIVPLDISGLPSGDHKLIVSANDAQGKTRAAAMASIVKLPPQQMGTRINRFTSCPWVNGQSRVFHALHVRPEDRMVRFMKSHGFNAVMMGMLVREKGSEAAVARTRKQLDDLHANGIGAIAWMRGSDQDVVRTIATFRDHPAMIAWKIIDEPYCASEALIKRYRAAKEADPYRPAFINWDHWYPRLGGRGSLLATDIGSRDAYPSGASSWVVDLATPMEDMALAFSVMGRDCVTLGKAAGFWQQIYGTDDAFREPTPSELRCFLFLGLIHRVRLTYYFTCIPMCVALWDTVAEAGGEMEWLCGQLASPEVIEIDRGTQSHVHYALWATGKNQACLLLCNAHTADSELSLSLSRYGREQARVVKSHDGRRVLPIREGVLRTKLLPYEAGMYVLTGAGE